MSEEPKEDTGVTSDDKLVSLLAYVIPLVPIVILLMEDKKSRPFIRAHNAQALIWGILIIAVIAVTAPLVLPLCLGLPVALVMWAIGVYWGIKAYQGEYVKIPVITDLTKNQGWA